MKIKIAIEKIELIAQPQAPASEEIDRLLLELNERARRLQASLRKTAAFDEWCQKLARGDRQPRGRQLK